MVESSALPGAAEDTEDGLDRILSSEPSPEFAALVAEEFRRRLNALGDEKLKQVALMRMEGYSDEETARHLGCTRRTIQRRLELIREEGRKESGSDVTARGPGG